MECRDLTLAIVGSGGDGVISAGEIIVKAAASEGLHCFLLKSFGPQIRGGESSCKIRLAMDPLLSIGEETKVLVCYSWADYARFGEEIRLADDAVIVSDTDDKAGDDLPIDIKGGQTWIRVPFTRLASEQMGNVLTKNIVSLGVMEGLFHLPEKGIAGQIRKRFAKKKQELIDLNLNAIAVGQKWAEDYLADFSGEMPTFADFEACEPNLVLTGNEAASMGALWSGLNFFAGYPITPASDVMEWLEKRLPRFNGTMIQAEDEIASAGMIIGASFAGAKSMTSTSGPGISLMSEMIGLAAMAEIPCVFINVQRGGPSTGIPTKTSQSDLLQALYCTHGDAPKVVLAATDAKDCAMVTTTAFYVSEKYQTPVIVLLDQFVGQRMESVPKYELLQRGIDEGWLKRYDRDTPSAEALAEGYKRFQYTESGVSPITHPGIESGDYIASGIEHNELGYPVSDVGIHRKMHDKRYKKMDGVKEELKFMRHYGDKNAKIGILCWGSTKGPAREAMIDAEKELGIKTRMLIPTCLMPLHTDTVQEFIDSCEKVIVTDSSYSAQFLTYLKTQVVMPAEKIIDLHFVDGMPLPVKDLKAKIKEVHNELA